MEVVLKKSNQKHKKYAVIVNDKTINFGAEGYEDYTTHKQEERKDRYTKRHQTTEDWTKRGIDTPGFWAKHILWNKPTLQASIKDTEQRFGIKIKQSNNKK
jgi:hypothetical protein